MKEGQKEDMFILRNIRRDEAEHYWPLRLEALKNHPEAFGASFEMSIQLPMSEVQERIHNEADDYILGAYTEEGILAATMGFKREHGLKLQHKGYIWGVYVSPPYRGRELEGIEQINLSVVTTNESARRLYERSGFETYGIERNALVVQGKGYDEAHMTYFYAEHLNLGDEHVKTGGDI
ncbi:MULTISPECIES: GNAT family N-acetyltransferase [unclassified Paenibacillus]|uniref:GNAT family N-acetyltransferase n=1 Tax=unclassified Paenibacillus TaxID=185978 RepID=UPI000417F259|nr:MULTISPECIES: GNAT family N-acetyltransferase [unclassified Paenibacillus]